MFTDQANRPRQRIGTGPRDSGLNQRIQHLTLRLAQPGHHRNGDVCEQDSIRIFADVDTPGHLASVASLRLVGDAHSVRAGLFPKAGGAALQSDGTNLALNDGRVAFQTVMHAHLHVVPRRGGDKLAFAKGFMVRRDPDLEATAQIIRAAVQAN